MNKLTQAHKVMVHFFGYAIANDVLNVLYVINQKSIKV